MNGARIFLHGVLIGSVLTFLITLIITRRRPRQPATRRALDRAARANRIRQPKE